MSPMTPLSAASVPSRGADLGRAVLRRLRGEPSYQDRLRLLIERHAPGRSFADIGAMWNVHGAYAFHANSVGTSAVTAVDVMAAQPEFAAANDRVGGAVRFVEGDINDPATAATIGTVDVLFCSGVVYHMPDPLWTLRQLRRACRDTLILGSAAIPDRKSTR